MNRFFGISLALAVLTSACGQSGDLYLPDQPPPTSEDQAKRSDKSKDQTPEQTPQQQAPQAKP